jgi:plasmid stability protein
VRRDNWGLAPYVSLCYCEAMKNITVTVDDDLYRRARIKAAETNTSVSAMVRAFLRQVTGEESDFERRLRLQQETIASIHAFSAGDRLSREQVHDRDTLS